MYGMGVAKKLAGSHAVAVLQSLKVQYQVGLGEDERSGSRRIGDNAE